MTQLENINNMKKEKRILLSFDLEEFDIPEEYGQKLSEEEKLDISSEGLKEVLKILDELNIRATFFTTAKFALHDKSIIKEMAKKHEIASHTVCHSTFSSCDLKESKKILEKITGKEVKGIRMPKLKGFNERKIKEAGYSYDSSLNPTYLPGRYNNFFKKRKMHYSYELLEIPVSVTPIIRFPLFWLSFKNFPLFVIKAASMINLSIDKYLVLYFHPWEFSDIRRFKLPFYVKRGYFAKNLGKRLKNYLSWLKTRGKFITFSEARL